MRLGTGLSGATLDHLHTVRRVTPVSGRTSSLVSGGSVIAIGEIIKVTLVEQVIEITKPKLLSFHWFAWMYSRWEGVLERLHSIRAWQAIRRQVKSLVARVREMKSDIEMR